MCIRDSPLEMQTTLSAEVTGNLCSKSRKHHFWRLKIKKFSRESMPPDLPSKNRLWRSIVNQEAIYMRNPSMQKGWLRPCVLCTIFSSDSVSLCLLTRTKTHKKTVIKNQCNLELEWSNLKMLGSGVHTKCVWAQGSTAKKESGLQSVLKR